MVNPIQRKDDMFSLPKSAEEARKRGTNKYYLGEPCINGHDSPRYTASYNCVRCASLNSRTILDVSDTSGVRSRIDLIRDQSELKANLAESWED